MSGKQAWDWFNSTEPSNVLVPGLQSYHIKGDIALSNLYSWSSSLAPPGKDGPEAWFFTFEKGAKLAVTVKAGDGRALCVHQ